MTLEVPKIQRRRISTSVAAGLAVEIFNKISPFIVLHLAQSRLGISAFGEAQFGIMLFETALPFVVGGYYLYGAIAVGQTKGDAAKIGSLATNALLLKAIHVLVIVALASAAFTINPSLSLYQPIVWTLSFTLLGYILDMYFVHLGNQSVWLLSVFTGVAKLCSLAFISLFVHDATDSILYAGLTIGANTFASVCTFLYVVFRYGLGRPSWAGMRALWHGALPYAAIVLAYGLIDRIDVFIAERFFASAGVGLYSGPLRIAQGIQPLVMTLSTVFLSELVAVTDRKVFNQHIHLGTWVLLATICPIAVGSWFVDDQIIALVLGSVLPNQGRIFSITVLGVLAYALTSIFGLQVLMLRGKRRQFIAWLLLGGVANAVAGSFFAPRFGILGVAAGASTGRLLTAVLALISARTLLDGLPWRAFLVPSLAALIMALVLWQFPLPSMFTTMALGAGVYAVALLALGGRELASHRLRL